MEIKPQLLPLIQRMAPAVYNLCGDLSRHLPWSPGERLDMDQLVKACFLACAERESLWAVTEGWTTPEGITIHPDTFRGHLDDLNDWKLGQLQQSFQTILDNQLRWALTSVGDEIERIAAIDCHEETVFLKDPDRSSLSRFVTGRPKIDKYARTKGKQPILLYLTISIVQPFHHVVAVRLITPLDDVNEVLKELVVHLRDTFGIRSYLLDRGFYNYELVRWFDVESGCSYLMPVRRTESVKPLLERIEAERLMQYRGTYAEFMEQVAHEIATSTRGGERRHPIRMSVLVSREYIRKLEKLHHADNDRRIKRAFRDQKLIGFVTNNLELITARMLNDLYKKRWRIETGYREVKEVLVRTKTPKVKLRVFWFHLACMIENIWEWVRRYEPTTMYQFKEALRHICHQSADEGYEMIAESARREGCLDYMKRLAAKTRLDTASSRQQAEAS